MRVHSFIYKLLYVHRVQLSKSLQLLQLGVLAGDTPLMPCFDVLVSLKSTPARLPCINLVLKIFFSQVKNLDHNHHSQLLVVCYPKKMNVFLQVFVFVFRSFFSSPEKTYEYVNRYAV